MPHLSLPIFPVISIIFINKLFQFWHNFFHAINRNMWTQLAEKGHWRGEIWNRRKNGEIFPEWLSITVVKADSGEITHYVATFQDITERKQAESDLQQAKELAESANSAKSIFFIIQNFLVKL